VFPTGFENKVKAEFPEFANDEGIVHLCSGLSTWGQYRFDIDPQSKATHIQDAAHTGLADGSARGVILDPYYSEEDYKYAGMPYVNCYDFLREGYRILKPGGLFLVLHSRPPKKPKGSELYALIAVSMGPDRQFRCCQIFRKPDIPQ